MILWCFTSFVPARGPYEQRDGHSDEESDRPDEKADYANGGCRLVTLDRSKAKKKYPVKQSLQSCEIRAVVGEA